MQMPGRTFSGNGIGGADYRYSFNGIEDDKQSGWYTQTYGLRNYDYRLGRFFSSDIAQPLYPHLSPYNFAANRPVSAIDVDGAQAWDSPNSFDAFSKNSWQNFVKNRSREILASPKNNFDCADLVLEFLAGYHKKMGVNLIVKVFSGERSLIFDSNDPKYQDNAKKAANGNYLTAYEYFMEDMKKWMGPNQLAQKTISYKINGKDLVTGDIVLYFDAVSEPNEFFHTQVINDEFSEQSEGKPHGTIQASGHYFGMDDPRNTFDDPQIKTDSYNFKGYNYLYRLNFLKELPTYNMSEMPSYIDPMKFKLTPEPTLIIPINYLNGAGSTGSGNSGGSSSSGSSGGQSVPSYK